MFLQIAFNGWTDEDSEGKWIALGNKTLSMETFQPWSSGEPNGDERENCGRINYGLNAWEDASCSNQHCIVCVYPLHITYNVRGLCPSSLFDTHYAWSRKGIDQDLHRGYKKSVMEWTEEGWRINIYNNPDTFAMFNESRNTPFTGTKYWNVVNDACKYDESNAGIHNKKSSRILLSLNTCSPNEYNCNDGTW